MFRLMFTRVNNVEEHPFTLSALESIFFIIEIARACVIRHYSMCSNGVWTDCCGGVYYIVGIYMCVY